MSLTILTEEQPFVPDIKEETISSDHNEEKPVLVQQYIKEEMDNLVISISGEEKDPHQISNKEMNIADTGNIYVKEEDCKIKKEDALMERFKTERSNLENENIMHSSYAQDVKFSIDVKEHNIEHLVNESNKAGMCQKKIDQDSSFNESNRTLSSEKIMPVTCRKCHKIFSTEWSFKTHIDKGINYECNHCKFSSVAYLKTHVSSIHRRIKQECNICHKIFPNVIYLKDHINRIHKCNECQQIFFNGSGLKSHVDAIHKGIKHKCTECHKIFQRVESLKVHANTIHKGIKHECNECHKIFQRVESLKVHINTIHKGIKHECNECHQMFSRKDRLKTHIDSIHKGMKYLTCILCERMFCKRDLKNHIKIVHKKL